jgi:hypothetical protein
LNAVWQTGILYPALGAARVPGQGAGAADRPGAPHALRDPGVQSAVAMTQEDERELRLQLARLQQEHRDLDAAISALQHSPGSDLLQVQRLKKRKLFLRDRISYIEDQLTPDIIA